MKDNVKFIRISSEDRIWRVEVDGTEVGELNQCEGASWYFDYSDGDETDFDDGLTIWQAKLACIDYLEKIGEV
ncbi:hypothetical protein [Lacticaseibacillus absianus]|uniref:hypothetical protein n=1 Tax=Lacticaseibacillus absianus TaxID=2729623 RepID=UPI0015C71DF4|nr:hypothetical protein [Lacticaseibacillus absianus]